MVDVLIHRLGSIAESLPCFTNQSAESGIPTGATSCAGWVESQ